MGNEFYFPPNEVKALLLIVCSGGFHDNNLDELSYIALFVVVMEDELSYLHILLIGIAAHHHT